MKFIKINGWSLSREPTSIEHSKVKLKKEDRTINGTLVVDIIAIKDKIKVQWEAITSEDLAKLQEILHDTRFVTLEYNDGKEYKRAEVETTELRYTPYYVSSTKTVIWNDVSMEFNEV